MIFNVRCFKCGDSEVRLVMGGRSIIHARCHGCGANLLAEVMDLEQRVAADDATYPPPDHPASESSNADVSDAGQENAHSGLDEDTRPNS